MDISHSLQALLNNTATEEDIALLRRLLASGEISIGGNVNQSVIIIGSGNTVELPPAALDRLNARTMLGNLDCDLTGEEIASGLRRLEKLLPNRAPVLLPHYKEQVGRLRPTLKTEIKALSETSRRERLESLAAINSICVEALDVSFNGLALGEAAPDYDARSPFRGLESFRPEDSEFFFGREALTRKLVAQIQAHPFLAVLGASGSGKSSLMMAGVIPALDSDYVVFRPGTNPLGELESARGKALIVVDQFEELFTLTRDESTRVDFIARLLDESSRARIILTLRSDFLGEVGAYRTLSVEIQNHLEIIPPMDMDELRRAMEGQAGVVGLRFEADLSQQILDDVAGEPGAMPLLQHALWELWNRRHGRNLRASEYRAFGGVKQAITSTAEKVYADCSKPEQEQVRDIFLRLTRLDESDEGRDTRRRVPLGDLIPSGRDAASITLLLDKLANARLIVKTVNADKTEVEVAHEALIRHWERLRIWLNEDRDDLRLRESVSESAKEWENAGKDESLLNHRGGRLDDALALGDNSRYGLTEIEQTYLSACVALRNREQRERERRRKITLASAFAVTVAIMAILVGWSISSTKSANANATQVSIANTAQSNAMEQANAASTAQANVENLADKVFARQLAIQAQYLMSQAKEDVQIAILVAVQSMRINPLSEAAEVLQNHKLAHVVKKIPHHNERLAFIAISPNGEYIVSSSRKGSVHIWDSAKEKETLIKDRGDEIFNITTHIAFNKDGAFFVSGDSDGLVQVWESASGREVSHMNQNGYVQYSAMSPDGKYAATSDLFGDMYIWDTKTGIQIMSVTHDRAVNSIAFSPDSNYVVSGSDDGSVRVWNLTTGKEIARKTHNWYISSTVFSSDGKYIASGGGDATILVWEPLSGNEIVRVKHDGGVTALAFSPDGTSLLSGGRDGTSRVWDISTGNEIARRSQSNAVQSIAYSPDGKYIVSGGCEEQGDEYCSKGVASLWESSSGREISYVVHNNVVISVGFDVSRKLVVSGSDDGAILIWSAGFGQDAFRVTSNYQVNSIAFSSNSNQVLIGTKDGTVQGWDFINMKKTSSIKHVLPDDVSNDAEISVVISPNGIYAATTECYKYNSNSECTSGESEIWNLSEEKKILHIQNIGAAPEVVFSPNERFMAISGCFTRNEDYSCKKGIIQIWDLESGKEIRNLQFNGWITSFEFSPDDSLIVSCCDYSAPDAYDAIIVLRSVITGKEIWRVNDGNFSSANFFNFSLDGLYLTYADSSGGIRIRNALNGQELIRLQQGDDVFSTAYSPNEEYLASGSKNKVLLWNATTGEKTVRLYHESGVWSVAFSSDGEYLVGGGADGTVLVWNIETKQEIARVTHKGHVIYAISPNSKYIASGADDGVSRIWLFRPEDLIADACSRVTRNLTRAEWQQYIGDVLPYQAVCPNLLIEAESTPTP